MSDEEANIVAALPRTGAPDAREGSEKYGSSVDVSDAEKASAGNGEGGGALDVGYERRDNESHLKAVLEFEERLANDEASAEEYRVENAHDVAIKVLTTKDDPDLPVLTLRYVFLGLGFSAFGATLAQIYYFKPQTLTVSTLFLLVIVYWLGNGMHYVLPKNIPFVNPGPFNIKEHVGIIIMCSTAATSATAIQVLSVQDLYYNNKENAGLAIFTLLGSQLIGYGFCGILLPILVYPTKTFWPSNISIANLFQTLHYEEGISAKKSRFFWLVFAGIFTWEIIPMWIWPWLGGINIVCLFVHNSAVVRNVFGGTNNNEGMGFGSLCLDWNYLSSTAFYYPIWTQINVDIGICLTYILMAGLYYTNVWNAKQFPFMSQAIFAADGTQYNQTLILTDNKFDPSKYAAVGPAFFSASNALYYITSNLSMGAVVTHIALFMWGDIRPFLAGLNPWTRDAAAALVHDEHFAVIRRNYKQVPGWWWYAVLGASFAIAQATNYEGHSGLPWWALIVLIILGFCFCFCYGLLNGLLGFNQFNSSGQAFFQMIGAYMVPGEPVANMYAALYGQHPMQMAILMLSDVKLGIYTKLPPRMIFWSQMIGTLMGSILNYVMMLSIVSANRAALLSIAGTRLWSGQNAQSYNSAAISWGALGPQMYGAHGVYKMVPISLAIGLFLPLPFYVLHRLMPTFGWENFNTSIITQYSCYMSVGVNSSINTTMAIGVFSQFYLRRYRPRWFTKYNYLLAAALDGGTQVIFFILNFAVFGASGHATAFPTWWGNSGVYSVDRCMAPDND